MPWPRRSPGGSLTAIPPVFLGGIGLLVFTAGLLALALLPQHPSVRDIVWRMVICGLGFGFFQSPNNRALLSSAPRNRSGGASGMLGTARLLGQTIGAALVAMLFGQIAMQATITRSSSPQVSRRRGLRQFSCGCLAGQTPGQCTSSASTALDQERQHSALLRIAL